MPWSYLSLNQLKRRLQDDDPSITVDDRVYRTALEAASRSVDQFTGRRFQPYTATRYYTARRTDRLEIGDLLTLTTLKTDDNGDGTHETTWDSNDYYLTPYDAPDALEPYTAIEITQTGLGNTTFPSIRRGVEIAGVWGWWLETEDTGTTVSGAHNTSVTTLAVADGTAVDVLDTLLIGSEAFYVTARSGNNLTVMRAQNGTTAASLSGGETVSRYLYPADVAAATGLMAARLFRRKDAPFGIAGSDEMGTSRVIPRMDPDSRGLLEHYRPVLVGTV